MTELDRKTWNLRLSPVQDQNHYQTRATVRLLLRRDEFPWIKVSP